MSRSKAAREAASIREKYANTPQKASSRMPTKKQLRSDPDAVSRAIGAVFYWRGRPIVRNDVEVADRLNEFFLYCQQSGEMPTMEKLALALGTYQARLKSWERGDSLLPGMTEATPEMLRKAKQMIQATDAELVINAAMNPVTYMFRAKNYYGMKDQAEQILVSREKPQSKEQLEKRYSEVVDVQYQEKKKAAEGK